MRVMATVSEMAWGLARLPFGIVRFLSETNKRREAWLGAMVWVGFLGILTYGVFH